MAGLDVLLSDLVQELGSNLRADAKRPSGFDLWPVAMKLRWLRRNQKKAQESKP
jgi:hypothetical protein